MSSTVTQLVSRITAVALVCTCMSGPLRAQTSAQPPLSESVPAWQLLPAAWVDGSGITLKTLLANPPATLPHHRLASSPQAGQPVTLTHAQINELLQQAAPGLPLPQWSGALQIKIIRRSRVMEETEIRELLTALLQREFVRERGELELRFTRPWTPAPVPDEPFSIRVLDMPTAGLTPNFIVRFDIRGTNNESFGQWQIPVQARLWRDVLVAGSSLSRGQGLATADIHPERRDTLTLREFIVALPGSPDAYELAESLSAGRELTGRSLRARPVIFRGKVVDAIAADTTLHISVKVEALEDGAPGQTIRVRNMQSKREFRAKIQNEATVNVSL